MGENNSYHENDCIYYENTCKITFQIRPCTDASVLKECFVSSCLSFTSWRLHNNCNKCNKSNSTAWAGIISLMVIVWHRSVKIDVILDAET